MKLSIITINYNNAEGLRKTLASVASQTYADIEHIIVDGGSTDGSVEIIREYADNQAKGERLEAKGTENSKADTPASTLYTLHLTPSAHIVRWISEPDKGIYNAMNKGIRMATGEYIEILNSGDILAAPDVTERMMAALAAQCAEIKGNEEVKGYRLEVKGNENGEADTLASRLSPLASRLENCPPIFYGNMIKEYPDGRRVVDRCFGDRGVRKSSDDIRRTEWTMYDFIRGTINHDPTYIRRDIYEKYGLYDDTLKIVSDWKWFVKAVVLGGEDVYYIPMDVTIFDMTGISETNLAAREVERRKELEKMIPMAVLKDYDAYHFPINQIQRLKRHHLWSLVYFVERVLFKLEKWGILKKY